MTTDWFTASPTPFGPPPALQPLVGRRRSPAIRPKISALISPAQRSDSWARAVKRRQVGAGRAALQDDVEEVAAGDADDADQAVEQHGDQHRRRARAARPGAGSGRCPAPPSRRSRRGSCARRGRRRSPSRRRRRSAAPSTIGAASRRRRAPTADPVKDWAPSCRVSDAELQRDDRAEGDRDQRRRQDRDAGDEPRLLEELADLERPLGTTRADDVERRTRTGCRRARGQRLTVAVTRHAACGAGGGHAPRRAGHGLVG